MDTKTSTKPTSIFKKYLLYVLIGGLTVTALIAIVAIIIGEWNDATSKAVWLTVSSWVHCLIALAVVSHLPNDGSKRGNYWNIFTYTVFGATIASFITTVLDIFDIIPAYIEKTIMPATGIDVFRADIPSQALVPAHITESLYFWYFGLILASLIISTILNCSIKKDKNTKTLAYVGVSSVVLLMILFFPPVFSAYIDFPDVYYRIILAVAIVFSTTSILSVVFGHLYRVKHPELASKPVAPIIAGDNPASESAPAKKRLPVWAIVLIVLGSVFIGLPVLGGLFILLALNSIF